jgi:hypothetical protein
VRLNIPKGYNPFMADRFLAYGNQSVFTRDLETGETFDHGGAHRGEPHLYAVGVSGDDVWMARQLPGNARELWRAPFNNPHARARVNVPAAYCPGLNGQRAVSTNGHVLCSVPAAFVRKSGGWRIFSGTEDITPTEHEVASQAILSDGGRVYAYPIASTVPWTWIVRRTDTQEVVTHYRPAAWWLHLNLQDALDGTHRLHAIGETGAVINGQPYDLPGETRGLSVWRSGQEIVLTCAWKDGRPWIVGRTTLHRDAPCSQTPDVLHSHLEARVLPNGDIRVAGCREDGDNALTVVDIPHDAPLSVWQPAPVSPLVVEPPIVLPPPVVVPPSKDLPVSDQAPEIIAQQPKVPLGDGPPKPQPEPLRVPRWLRFLIGLFGGRAA